MLYARFRVNIPVRTFSRTNGIDIFHIPICTYPTRGMGEPVEAVRGRAGRHKQDRQKWTHRQREDHQKRCTETESSAYPIMTVQLRTMCSLCAHPRSSAEIRHSVSHFETADSRARWTWTSWKRPHLACLKFSLLAPWMYGRFLWSRKAYTRKRHMDGPDCLCLILTLTLLWEMTTPTPTSEASTSAMNSWQRSSIHRVAGHWWRGEAGKCCLHLWEPREIGVWRSEHM